MLQNEPLPLPLPWGRLAFNALPALAQYYQLNLTGFHGSHRVLRGGYWGACATYCGSALYSIDFYRATGSDFVTHEVCAMLDWMRQYNAGPRHNRAQRP